MKPIQGRFKTSDTFFNILMVTFSLSSALFLSFFNNVVPCRDYIELCLRQQDTSDKDQQFQYFL